jgi:hypothetical protein
MGVGRIPENNMEEWSRHTFYMQKNWKNEESLDWSITVWLCTVLMVYRWC